VVPWLQTVPWVPLGNMCLWATGGHQAGACTRRAHCQPQAVHQRVTQRPCLCLGAWWASYRFTAGRDTGPSTSFCQLLLHTHAHCRAHAVTRPLSGPGTHLCLCTRTRTQKLATLPSVPPTFAARPQSARVTIKISDRAKMDPNAGEREVTISGLHGAVKLAEAMVAEKLNLSRARSRGEEEEH